MDNFKGPIFFIYASFLCNFMHSRSLGPIISSLLCFLFLCNDFCEIIQYSLYFYQLLVHYQFMIKVEVCFGMKYLNIVNEGFADAIFFIFTFDSYSNLEIFITPSLYRQF